MNAAPAELAGNTTKDHLLNCFAGHMLKRWTRSQTETVKQPEGEAK